MATVKHIDKEDYAAKALELLNDRREEYVNYALGLVKDNLPPGVAGERLREEVCSENYDAYPGEVSAEDDEYTLKIVSRVREGQRTCYPEDWHYWCAMISVSDGCLISIKKGSGDLL